MSGLQLSQTEWDKAAAADAAESGRKVSAVVRLVRHLCVNLLVAMGAFHLLGVLTEVAAPPDGLRHGSGRHWLISDGDRCRGDDGAAGGWSHVFTETTVVSFIGIFAIVFLCDKWSFGLCLFRVGSLIFDGQVRM